MRQKILKDWVDAISCAESTLAMNLSQFVLEIQSLKVQNNAQSSSLMFLESIKKPAISIREVSCDNVCSYGIVDGNKIDDEVYKIT